MPRKIQHVDGSDTLTVYGHAITRNFWEYYILDNEKASDYRFALVMGYETEMGDVSMKEIKPFVFSYTENLQNIAPPEGYRWVD